MATKRRLIHFLTFDNFNLMKLSANDDNTQYTVGINGEIVSGTDVDVPYLAIAFIKDTELIWTHGKLYNNTLIVDLGIISVEGPTFTISNEQQVLNKLKENPLVPIIFKYSFSGVYGTNCCPVSVSKLSDIDYKYCWHEKSLDVTFQLLVVLNDSSLISNTSILLYAYKEELTTLSSKVSSFEGKIDTNTNNIGGLRTELNKLLAIDNVYIMDFASISTILDDLPSEDDGSYLYETYGNGELLVNPLGVDRTATYVMLYDSEYLEGITPVWTEYVSDTLIKVSFISDKHDRILFISFYVNPTTNTAWGLLLKLVYEGREVVMLDLGTITENYENNSFTCTGSITSIRNALNESINNYGHMNAFVKYKSSSISTYCPLKVEIPRTGYYTLLWQSLDYTYSLGITNSGSTYNGALEFNSKVGTNLYLSGNTLSLRNSSNIALSSVNLPSLSITKDLTSSWNGTLNFNEYDYAYATLTSNKVISSITGPRGHYLVTLSLGDLSSVNLYATLTDNIRYFKDGVRIPSGSYYILKAHQTIILDITIDSTIIVNIITVGENSPLLSTSQYTTATLNMIFFRTTSNITGTANISSLVSGMDKGICTLVFNNASGYNINASGTNWKGFLNGAEEAFPITLSAGLHIVKVTKWDDDTAIVEITG